MSEEGTRVRDRDVMTEAEIRERGSCGDDTLLALSMEEGALVKECRQLPRNWKGQETDLP